MGHHQELTRVGVADGDIPFLVKGMIGIIERHRQGITKYCCSLRKRDLMLVKIPLCFFRVPLKSQRHRDVRFLARTGSPVGSRKAYHTSTLPVKPMTVVSLLRALGMLPVPRTAPLPRASWQRSPRQTGSARRRCRTRRPHGTWGRRCLDRKPGVPLFDLLDPLRTAQAMLAVVDTKDTSCMCSLPGLCSATWLGNSMSSNRRNTLKHNGSGSCGKIQTPGRSRGCLAHQRR